jgi:hypothetical protein
MTALPYKRASRAAYNALPPGIRRVYREEKDENGDGVFLLNVDTADDWSALETHSEIGPLVRAYRRKQADLEAARARIADLEENRVTLPPDFDADLWARRHEIDGTAALRRRLARELEEIERAAAAEIETLRAERLRWEAWLARTDTENGLRAAVLRAGVKPKLAAAVVAMLQDAVVTIGGTLMARTPRGHLSLDEFVRQWASTDDAHAYMEHDAPRYSGGHASTAAAAGGESFADLVKKLR